MRTLMKTLKNYQKGKNIENLKRTEGSKFERNRWFLSEIQEKFELFAESKNYLKWRRNQRIFFFYLVEKVTKVDEKIKKNLIIEN